MIKRLQVSWVIVLAIGLVYQDMAQCDTWAERLSGTNVSLYSKPILAKEMRLRDTKGHSVDLSTFKGKLTLLNFWNIDSIPCVMEKTILERIYREMKNDGVEIIAVNLIDNYHNVIPYAKRKGYTFTVAYDPDKRYKIENRPTKESQSASFVVNPISKAIYEVPALPTTYIIDPRGRIIGRAVGMVNWAQAPFREFLLELATRTKSDAKRAGAKQVQPTPVTNKPRLSALEGPGSLEQENDFKMETDSQHGPKRTNPKDKKSRAEFASNHRILLAQAPAARQPANPRLTVPEARELPEAQPLTQSPPAPSVTSPRPAPQVNPEAPDNGPSAHRLIPLPRALPYTPPGAATSVNKPQQPNRRITAEPRVNPDEDGYVMATVPGSSPAPKGLKPGAGQGIGDYPVISPAEEFILRAFEGSPFPQAKGADSPTRDSHETQNSAGNSPIESITSGIRNVISNINPFQ